MTTGRKTRYECEASHQKQPAVARHLSTGSMFCTSPDQVTLNGRAHCFGASEWHS